MSIVLISKKEIPDPMTGSQTLAALNVDDDTFSMIVPTLSDTELGKWLTENYDKIRQTIDLELESGSVLGQRIRVARIQRSLQNVPDSDAKTAMLELSAQISL